MHDSPPDDDEENSPADRDPERGAFDLGLGGHIGRLLDFLENAERRDAGPPGKTPKGAPRPGDPDRFSVDLGVSVGSLGDGESSDRSRPRRRSRRRRVHTGSDEYLTAARREGDDVVLTFDLPGLDEDDVSVGLASDGDRLVVGAEGEELARVPLAGADRSSISATFNNYVLEVRVDGDALAVEPEEVIDG